MEASYSGPDPVIDTLDDIDDITAVFLLPHCYETTLICFSSTDTLPSEKPPDLIKCADDREISRKTVYKMAYDSTHGFAVIISNTNFPEEKREGNQKDEDNLSKTFQYLGYTVVIYQDCDSKEMVDVLNTIAQSTAELEGHDSFVCCILSHGKEEGIVAVDGQCVKLEDITSPMKECKALNGKPKMFFIQACRGTMSDKGIVCDGDGEDSVLKIPKEADFFFGYATPRGYKAKRNEVEGSYYIKALCETFCRDAKHASLVHMHTMINDKVATEEYGLNRTKQISVFESQLRKLVYFFEVPASILD